MTIDPVKKIYMYIRKRFLLPVTYFPKNLRL